MNLLIKLLFFFSWCKYLGGKKTVFDFCKKCNTHDTVYYEYGDLLFLMFIPTGIKWERKKCERCGNIKEVTLKISPLFEQKLSNFKKN